MQAVKPLTTTSYALLGLLAIQPWTTYELAKQLTRSLRFFWPRAESKLYEEPKNLVQRGLAESRVVKRGGRAATVYSITLAGRAALAEWLSRSGAGSVVEFEQMLQVYLADNGSKEDLLRTIRAIEAEAETRIHFGRSLAREYLDGRGPFPRRLHVQALVFGYLWEYFHALARWARWAAGEVEGWPDTSDGPDSAEAGLAILRRFVEAASTGVSASQSQGEGRFG
jgi:DNA-binding PadR family transcriptional regulator